MKLLTVFNCRAAGICCCGCCRDVSVLLEPLAAGFAVAVGPGALLVAFAGIAAVIILAPAGGTSCVCGTDNVCNSRLPCRDSEVAAGGNISSIIDSANVSKLSNTL